MPAAPRPRRAGGVVCLGHRDASLFERGTQHATGQLDRHRPPHTRVDPSLAQPEYLQLIGGPISSPSVRRDHARRGFADDGLDIRVAARTQVRTRRSFLLRPTVGSFCYLRNVRGTSRASSARWPWRGVVRIATGWR